MDCGLTIQPYLLLSLKPTQNRVPPFLNQPAIRCLLQLNQDISRVYITAASRVPFLYTEPTWHNVCGVLDEEQGVIRIEDAKQVQSVFKVLRDNPICTPSPAAAQENAYCTFKTGTRLLFHSSAYSSFACK